MRRSRKIFGRGIGGPEIFLECGLRRRGPFRDKGQLQVVDDPVDNGMLREEGDDRSASAFVLARTRLWTLFGHQKIQVRVEVDQIGLDKCVKLA